MGNKHKSQRTQLSEQRREKMLSSLRSQPPPIQKTIDFNKSSIITKSHNVKNNETQQSILNSDSLKFELTNQRDVLYKLIYDNFNSYQIRKQNTQRLDDSRTSTAESDEEKEIYVDKLCCNLDKYCKQITLQLYTYNLEMKMEKITNQNWVEFCQNLDKYNVFPKMKSSNHLTSIDESKKSDDAGQSFSNIPLKQNFSTVIREQAQNLNQYSQSATNLDDHASPSSRFTRTTLQNQIGLQKYQSEEIRQTFVSKIHQTSHNLSPMGSVCGQGNRGFFQTQNTILSKQSYSSGDNQSHIHHQHRYQNVETIQDERQLKDDLKKFKMYMRESDEVYQMFRKVSNAFETAFFSIYGKDEQKVSKQFMNDPELTEMRLSIEIMYIVRVFESLIDNIMEQFSKQQDKNYNVSQIAKKSFMASMEFKTYPIINMLLSYAYKVFQRIRFILVTINKESTQQLKINMQKYINDKLYQGQIKYMRNSSIPYEKSIEEYKKASILIRKNMISGIKYLVNVVRPVIINEIDEQEQLLRNLKKQQSSSCLQSTSLHSPQSLAEKSILQFTQNEKLLLAKSSSIEGYDYNEPILKQMTLPQTIEEEEEFIFQQDSKIKIENQYVSQQQQVTPSTNNNGNNNLEFNKENIPVLKITTSNVENIETPQQNKAYGADDLVPVFEYIIPQVEMNSLDTIYYDLKVFFLIFDNIQDRVTSYSSSILNASHILTAYKSLLILQEKNPNFDYSIPQ